MDRRHCPIRAALLAGMLAIAPPGLAQTSATPALQSPVDALVQDAGEYARHYGVDLAEAMRRLRAQEETVPATDRIRAQYHDRLTGIAIEHRPAYRIVVLLTGPEPVPDQSVFAGGMTVPISFHTGAIATREQLLAALLRRQADIRGMLASAPGIGVDAHTGELVVTARGDEAADPDLAARLAALTGVPVRVAAVDRGDADFAAIGGLRIDSIDAATHRRFACTSGFVVTDGATTALATAAHCPDALTWREADGSTPDLRFVDGWGAGYRDVQINAAEGAPLEPVFRPDPAVPAVRGVTGWRNRDSMRAGDYVCHAGERTGYSCAEVEFVDYAPAGDICYGPCPPTWVAVSGPSCKGGDSGGPVFSGTTAFGLLKGGSYRTDGRCNFYVFMSTDYLPPPWRLLYR